MCRPLVAVLVAAGCLAQPVAAAAHAVLVHSTPHRDATVQQAPREVVVDFNEPVGASAGAVRVFDAEGERVDAVQLRRPRPQSVAVRVPASLPAGTYTATYRVVSADGHPVSGGLVFGVRAPVRAGASGPPVEELLDRQEAGPLVEALHGTVRGLHYLALLLLVGAVAFRLVVWRGEGRWPGRLLLAAGVAGLVTSLLAFPLQGLLATGTGVGTALSAGVTEAALEARAGVAWLVRAGLWAALLAVLASRRPWARGDAAVAGLVVAGLVATLPWGGHATTQEPRTALVASDVLHVVAGGAWLGGLVLLLLAGLSLPALRAFSRMAVVAIALLVAAGTLQAWFYLGSVGALVDGPYGLALLAKAALVAVVVVLGALNRRALARASTAGLRRAMRAEVGIAVLVLVATVVLVRAAPPVAATQGPQTRDLVLGPMRMELVAEPAQVGSNAFHLYLFDRRTGAQVDEVDAVLLTLVHAGRDLRFKVAVGRKGPAHYELLGQPLPAEGRWDVRVEVREGEFDLYTARTTLNARAPG